MPSPTRYTKSDECLNRNANHLPVLVGRTHEPTVFGRLIASSSAGQGQIVRAEPVKPAWGSRSSSLKRGISLPPKAL
jgi:hypothetical protein